mgnify:CR=1 FL=1
MSGVRIGESSVETLVIVTDKAKSPLDMKVMTLEEVPPGQVPTKTTPAVRAGSKLKAIASKKASEGMIRYWAQTPTKTSTAHAEHNNAQQGTQNRDAADITDYPFKAVGYGHAQDKKYNGDDTKVFAYQMTKRFHCVKPLSLE